MSVSNYQQLVNDGADPGAAQRFVEARKRQASKQQTKRRYQPRQKRSTAAQGLSNIYAAMGEQVSRVNGLQDEPILMTYTETMNRQRQFEASCPDFSNGVGG